MKKLVFASILFLISTACFAENEKILVGKHYTQEEFTRFQNYEVIYNFPLTERTIKIFATQKKSKKTVTPNPLSLYEDNKFLVLYDKKGTFLDAVGMYMFSGTYYDSAYISDDAFCFKHHCFDTEGYPHRFVYADNNSLQFKYFDAEPWVSSILISGKYLLWSIEMDTNTVCRVDMTNGGKIQYNGYFPNVDFFTTVNKNYLGCFQYKKKWYVITETEIVEVAEEPAHSERKRLDNFWVTRKWLPTEVSKNIKSGKLELLDVVLKDTDLASLSKSELRILRNMIYAKHGYKFNSKDLLDFFSQFEWYKPRYSNVDAMLSKTDFENVERIRLYEQFSSNIALTEKDLIDGVWQDMPIMAAGWSDTFIFKKGGKIQFHVSQMNEDEYFCGYEGEYKIEKSFLRVSTTDIYINENNTKKAIHLPATFELNYPISGFEKGKEVIAGYRKNSVIIGNVEFFQFEDEMLTKNW